MSKKPSQNPLKTTKTNLPSADDGTAAAPQAEFGAARVGRKRPRGPRRSATRRANEAKGTGKPDVAQRVVKSLSPISDAWKMLDVLLLWMCVFVGGGSLGRVRDPGAE